MRQIGQACAEDPRIRLQSFDVLEEHHTTGAAPVPGPREEVRTGFLEEPRLIGYEGVPR